MPHRPIYQLTQPVRLAVESDQGMVTSYLYPGRRLHHEIPNNRIICNQLLNNDYTAFLVTPPTQQHVLKKMLSPSIYPYGNDLSKYLSSLVYDGKPWVVFLKTNNIEIPSRSFDSVQVRSVGVKSGWQFDALTSNNAEVKEEEVDVDFPEDLLAAPPPFHQSLCVGPEYPRPYPVLYSFPPASGVRPGLGSYSVNDLTPAVATTIQDKIL